MNVMNCKQWQTYKYVVLACSCLILLFVGVGVSPEPAWGLETKQVLFEAEHGDEDAAYFLGVMYRVGSAVSLDCNKALKWTEQAASQGHALAQSHLGKIYSDGCGEKVAKDPVKAYMWTSMAAKQGLRFAKTNLEELEGQLHRYLVVDAQREVAERLRNFTPATRRGNR